MTTTKSLLHANALMHGALERVNSSLATYFDKIAEIECNPFIDPELGTFVENILDAVNMINDDDAVLFFGIGTPVTMDDLTKAADEANGEAAARTQTASQHTALNDILSYIRTVYPLAEIQVGTCKCSVCRP